MKAAGQEGLQSNSFTHNGVGWLMAQRSLTFSGDVPLKLKPVSKVFLAAEALDILTTFIGLSLHPQMWEANPVVGVLGGMVQAALFKLLVTLAVVYVIEKVDSWPRLIWVVPLMASVPVFWNLFSISVEFMYAPETLAIFSALGELK
jgi:hypothetical protein